MSYKIAIASGKGGTGKTSISINLYYYINKLITDNILLVDCDVEEPNDAIFFPESEKVKTEDIFQMIPKIDHNKCNDCKQCVEYCEFNAITIIPSADIRQINSSLCHSCGACFEACDINAITEVSVPIGQVNYRNNNFAKGLVEGKLKIGSVMQTRLIGELKQMISTEHKIIVYDAPPGTSCPVVETISDCQYVILVCEPTPFGIYDMNLMIALLENINIEFGIIINKSGIGNKEIYSLIKEKKYTLLGEIPFDKQYASKYASGELLSNIPEKINSSYIEIVGKLKNIISL